jgi:hypothetical protein
MKVLLCLCLTLCCLVKSADFLDARQQSEKKFLIPRNILFPLTAYQPDCPIKFDDVKFVGTVKSGTGHPVYSFRNNSNKVIISYTIVYRFIGGGGGRISSDEAVIHPGEIVTIGNMPANESLVSFTSRLRDIKDSSDKMENMLILTVVQVKFSDGSFFEDKKACEALDVYLESIS